MQACPLRGVHVCSMEFLSVLRDCETVDCYFEKAEALEKTMRKR
jgi:hypothetical protein